MNRRSGRPNYLNDDYSPYAGPDYRRERYSEQDKSFHGTAHQGGDHYGQPGVSGKDRDQGSWFNESQYQTQRNFVGKGPKGYRRQDASIHEEVCEVLTRDPRVDASNIEVGVTEGIVTLRGEVPDRFSKRRAENSVEGLTGVVDVYNELRISRPDDSGTVGMVKNQSRLPS